MKADEEPVNHGLTLRIVTVVNKGLLYKSALALVGYFAASTFAWSSPELKGYAFIQDDGSIRVRNKTIHLYGIHIPETDRTCRRQIRPVMCASRAALALDFKIGTSFVRCIRHATHSDRSITATCEVDDEDLSAYLLERGWAVALPDAPIEYQTLERIARSRKLGVWGFPVGEQ